MREVLQLQEENWPLFGPPPRAGSSLRSGILPEGTGPLRPADPQPLEAYAVRERRRCWAELMQRVFAVDVLARPQCGGRMRLLAAIHAPGVARAILECVDLPSRAPPNEPPRPLPEQADLYV